MTDLSLILRAEMPADAAAIERLHARAFGPGRYARTAFRLREAAQHRLDLSFTALVGTLLVGSVRLTLIRAGAADALLLGPLTVDPSFEGRGIGGALMRRALDALCRELREEASIEIAPGPDGAPRLHGVFFNDRASRRDHVLVYVARDVRVLGERAPDREIAEAGFFPLDQLPEETSPATRARLDEVAGRRAVSGRW